MRAVECILISLLVGLTGAACSPGAEDSLPGTLEWDRVGVLAKVSEPVIALEVHEGEAVSKGQELLRLDPRRTDAQLAAARADAARLTARLDELRHGARIETIDADRAQLSRAQSDAANARRTYERARALRKRGLNAQSDLDNARTAFHMAEDAVRSAQAQLDELLHGTRPEDIAQAEADLASAKAQVLGLELKRERIDVRAPRAGRVDALPYRLGDQPPVGATLVSMLAGDAPYARVYVPEPLRVEVRPGQRYRVYVDGVDHPFPAVVRSVRSEASFTPYYALSGDDASRLVYRAELPLQGAAARRLPAGIPCHAEPVHDAQP